MSNQHFYTKEVTIKTHIDKVWDALINPELTKHYMFGCEPISDWTIGSKLFWRGAADGIDYVIGTVLKFEPNSTLAFTVFDPNSGYDDLPQNYLISEYLLTDLGNETLVKISQGDFSKVTDGEKRYQESAKGWKMALDAMKKILEQ